MHFLIRLVAEFVTPVIERAFGRWMDRYAPSASPSQITLGNHNRSLAPLLIAAIFFAIPLFALLTAKKETPIGSDTRVALAVCAILGLVSMLISLRMIWSVRISDEIVLIRPLGTRHYSFSNLRQWHLAAIDSTGNRVVFGLWLEDNEGFETIVYANKAKHLLTLMQAHAPQLQAT